MIVDRNPAETQKNTSPFKKVGQNDQVLIIVAISRRSIEIQFITRFSCGTAMARGIEFV